MNIIRVENVTKEYRSGERRLAVVKDVNLEVPAGQFLAIVGPSGSGKSTLLGIIAGLDNPTAGRVYLDGREVTSMKEDDLARLRAEKLGFVFQSYQLIPTLTAMENVALPLELLGRPGPEERALELLAAVGLAGRANHYPVQLSGGEQQRVAVARAFAARPPILLADEPTGNLDAASGKQVIDLILQLKAEQGATVVLVTHNLELAARADRILALRDGAVVRDEAVVR